MAEGGKNHESPRRRTSSPTLLAAKRAARLDSLVAKNRFSQNQSKPWLAFIPSTAQLTIDQHYQLSTGFEKKLDTICPSLILRLAPDI
jgi:hypothetical protein